MPATLSEIVTEINLRFPRNVTDQTNSVTASMYDMLRDVCGRYPFWFLRYDPGSYLPTQFDMSAADLVALTHYKTYWVDRGWLHVTSGVDKYPLAGPAIQGQYDANATYWQYIKASRVNFVNEYNLKGSFVQSLYVEGGSSFFCHADWSSAGQPKTVFLETGVDGSGNECSWLRFAPIPDDNYLYAISFYSAEPIATTSGGSGTNRLFQEYPEVAICAGLLAAAEYFGETQWIQYYRAKLWGEPPRGGIGKLSPSAGLIGRMVADSMRQREQNDQTIPQYLGARGAVGRSGNGLGKYWARGVYIGRRGFS